MKLSMKSREATDRLLEGAGRVVLLACKCCIRDFLEDRSEGTEDAKSAIADAGLTLAGCEEVDFLCNVRTTSKMLDALDTAGIDAIATYSCGIGTQTLAAMTDLPILPLADSEGYTAFEGFETSDSKLCRACGECVLNDTGGICPVALCSKSLLNGQCGGAMDGKCEIDPKKDCVWLAIHERLEKQGRTSLVDRTARIRTFNPVAYSDGKKMREDSDARRDESYPGGVHPIENKEMAEGKSIEDAPVPDILVLPMAQHIGKPCEPTVSAGDQVKRGQVIGSSTGFVSSPVHSPVSGTVSAVEARPHPVSGQPVLSVVIDNDHKDTLCEDSLPPLEDRSQKAVADRIVECGIVGMGGAMFPTHVKMASEEPIDVLLINGCECEPYLTSDHRVMLEHTEQVVSGVLLMAEALGASRCVIAIEENKEDAAEAIRAAVGDRAEVCVLPTKYPQGAERMLVYAVTGRSVPRGGIPLAVGVVVSNVSTALAVSKAVNEGTPLMERIVTVTGPFVKRPGNYRVRMGTSFADLLEPLIGGREIPDGCTVRMGGPMMGLVQNSLDVPVIKGTTGITLVDTSAVAPDDDRVCVRCGRCVDTCPMDLVPHRLWYHVKKENWDQMEALEPANCIECGCCDYICSAKLPLTDTIRIAKRKSAESSEGKS